MEILVGGVVGFLIGLTGVGGGAVMTPFLILIMGESVLVAVATDLIFAVTTKATGLFWRSSRGRPNLAILRKLWLGSIPAALIGALLLATLFSDALIFFTFLLALLIGYAGLSLISPKVGNLNLNGRHLSLIGGGIGLGVGLTSVGAGALTMATLIGLPTKTVKPSDYVATDLAHSIPLALVAAAPLATLGYVDWWLLAQLLIGSIPAVIIGRVVSQKLAVGLLKRLLGIALVVASAAVFLKIFV